MKKLFGLLALGLTVILLASCSKKDDLSGDYYWISENRNQKILTINGDTGVLESEGTHKVKIDKKTNTFEIKGFMNPTVKYIYKDGVLTANLTGVKRKYYKKGSEAYKKALKKYNAIKKKEAKKEKSDYNTAKKMAKTGEVKKLISDITENNVNGNMSNKDKKFTLKATYVAYEDGSYEVINLYKVDSTDPSDDNSDGYETVYGYGSLKAKNGKLDISDLSEDNLIDEVSTNSGESYQEYFTKNNYVKVTNSNEE